MPFPCQAPSLRGKFTRGIGSTQGTFIGSSLSGPSSDERTVGRRLVPARAPPTERGGFEPPHPRPPSTPTGPNPPQSAGLPAPTGPTVRAPYANTGHARGHAQRRGTGGTTPWYYHAPDTPSDRREVGVEPRRVLRVPVGRDVQIPLRLADVGVPRRLVQPADVPHPPPVRQTVVARIVQPRRLEPDGRPVSDETSLHPGVLGGPVKRELDERELGGAAEHQLLAAAP